MLFCHIFVYFTHAVTITFLTLSAKPLSEKSVFRPLKF